MKKAPIPSNEQARLEALDRLEVLDTESEFVFDEITELAAELCQTKISLISLVDRSRQWFKSKWGLSASETPRDISFCGHAILGEDIFEIPNAENHPDFQDNPLFLGEPHVRFYAGAPLITSEGHHIGTLCVIDDQERHLSELQKNTLRLLSKHVINLLELRNSLRDNKFINQQLERAQSLSKIGSWFFDLKTKEQFWSKEHYRIFEIPYPQPKDRLFPLYRERIFPEDLIVLDKLTQRAIEYGEDFVFDHRIKLDDGHRIKYVQGIGSVIKDDKGQPIALTGTCRDVTDQSRVQKNKERVSQLRQVYIENKSDPNIFWNEVLRILLEASESKFGFIGEVRKDNEQNNYLKTFALTNIAWSPETHKLFQENATKGFEFRNLNTLFGKVLRTGAILITNEPLKHPSSGGVPHGHPPLNSFMGIPLHYAGKFIGMVGIANREQGYDLSFYKELEELFHAATEIANAYLLEKSVEDSQKINEFYRKALDEQAIVAFTDANGKITDVNDMFCKISEYSKDELIGQDHRILNSGLMGKEFFKQMWKTISSGTVWNGKICNKAKSGRLYWVDTTIVPFKEKDGRILNYIAIRRDITSEVYAEELAKNRSKQIDSIFLLSLDLLCVMTFHGAFKRTNPAFQNILGYKDTELLQSSLHELIHPEDIPLAQLAFQQLNRGEKIIGLETRCRCKEGKYKTLSWSFAPDSETQLVYAVARDVTEERRKQNDLIQLTKDLEIAKGKAEEATRAKSEFLSVMSHEIRTPLNGVIGMSEMLNDTPLNEDQKEITHTISQSGKTLLTIINDILDFSKVEAGKLELENVEFDLHSYLMDILKPHAFAANKKGLSFETHIPKFENNVIGDSGRLGQIVNNIVGNAIKFTQSGWIKVYLYAQIADSKTQITLEVQDTGVGIPLEAKDRMFLAFSQAQHSTSRQFGGTGLGLSISKKLVQMMGGEISFESRPQLGTTFSIKIPFQTGSSIPSSSYPNTNEDSLDTPLRGRILVAEDNATNQLVIGRILEKFGLQYMLVANGHEALDALREARFDLVLMDCEMPEMDGYTATRLIRKSETLPKNIPIIALTAHAIASEEKKCMDAGMNAFATKPIHRATLKNLLAKYLT